MLSHLEDFKYTSDENASAKEPIEAPTHKEEITAL
jgi:hypothetical protein